MAGFFDFGFARVAVNQSFKKENENPQMDKSKRMSSSLAFFGGKNEEYFRVTHKIFNFKSVSLVNCSNKGPIVEEKKNYLELFSSKAWNNLAATQRAYLSVSNSRACNLEHLLYQEMLPLRSNRLKKPSISSVAFDELNKTAHRKLTITNIKEAAKTIYDKINDSLKENFNMNFNEPMVKVPTLILQLKKVKLQQNSNGGS